MSPRPDDWPCEAVTQELERLIDGDLSSSEAAAMERHLTGCAICRADLDLAERIRDELRALPHMDAPAAIIQSVKATARREHAASRYFRWLALRPSPVWALAAALLLAAVLAPLVLAPPAPEVARLETIGSRPMDPAEVERATEEVRVALAYVGQVTRRTGLEIRDELILERLVKPAAEGLSSLHGAPGAGARGEANET